MRGQVKGVGLVCTKGIEYIRCHLVDHALTPVHPSVFVQWHFFSVSYEEPYHHLREIRRPIIRCLGCPYLWCLPRLKNECMSIPFAGTSGEHNHIVQFGMNWNEHWEPSPHWLIIEYQFNLLRWIFTIYWSIMIYFSIILIFRGRYRWKIDN